MLHTKIVATLGPATAKKRMILKLIQAGVSVFRLNFSYGTPGEHAQRITAIRACAKQLNRAIAIMADLQGPKIRTGKLKDTCVYLRRGRTVVLTTKKIQGDEDTIAVDYARLPAVVKKGMILILSEGMIKLRVLSTAARAVRCKVIQGGLLGEHKGVNVVGLKLASTFTAKDRRDIRFALKHKVDYIALSFVRDVTDVIRIKKFIGKRRRGVPLIAKIEKPEAIRHLREILQEVEGVMVARGDLGIEGKLEEVPLWQKKIIYEANRKNKIVITATQMLESMIHAPTPTRAEVTDVANAIFDGTCAVMLSGETAIGKYPLQVIRTMRRIIRATERSKHLDYYLDYFDIEEKSTTFSVAHAAIDAAREAQVKAIVVLTISGFTARFISKRHPRVPIFAITPHEHVYNQMSLLWGVYPICTSLGKDIETVIARGMQKILQNKLLKRGDTVVVVFGSAEQPGGTDRMKIMTV